MSNSMFDERDAAEKNRLARKAKESPFMIAGIAGFVASAVIGAYKYKHRGGMSTSVFLMQLRVIAQSAVVGSLTAGMALRMLNEYVLDKNPKQEASH